jgi:RNA polymerase sigma-70 factor (ECF subfamily)
LRPQQKSPKGDFVFNYQKVSNFCKSLLSSIISSYNLPTMSTRTNETWLTDLRSTGIPHEEALNDLRDVIQKGLPYALSRWLSSDDPLFQPLVEEVTQETLLRVLDQLDTFQGRSLFTTWVHKIAIRIALTELRRKRWRDASLDELTENEDAPPPPGLLADPQASPETSAERKDMLERVRRILQEELTPKQREALTLLGLQDIPMEEAAKKMKTNRNALYKLLHDARLRLKKRLSLEDLTPQDLLSAFEQK